VKTRPKLTLEFDGHKVVDEADPAGATIPYLRLAVTNAEGGRTAEHVQVLIVNIKAFATSSAGSGGQVIWLADPALGWANSVDKLPRMSIPPGTTRYVDMGCWHPQIPLGLELGVVPRPNNNRHVLSPGGWKIRLAATMRNGNATFWDARVSYDASVQAGVGRPVKISAEIQKVESASG
jgi:hypothetical protein